MTKDQSAVDGPFKSSVAVIIYNINTNHVVLVARNEPQCDVNNKKSFRRGKAADMIFHGDQYREENEKSGANIFLSLLEHFCYICGFSLCFISL